MLVKISLSGIKSRWKDYLVLFSGMIITTAIFYMFEAISTNDKFTTGNPVGQSAKFVFIFGSILLAIITLVYVFYANSFLMSMRKHDYGLFMMLGAKSGIISKLIAVETMVIGFISTIIGIVFGIGFTEVLSHVLASQIHMKLTNFSALYMPAVWVTIIMFLALFLVAGFLNARTFVKTSALQLLRSGQKSDWKQPKAIGLWIQAVMGILLLAGGYYAMYDIKRLKLMAVAIGLITIVLGTYLVFNSFFVMLLQSLQGSKLSTKGLNSFTLAQLKFRIRDYTKILSVVSLLFALALGAITVGTGFQNMVPKLAEGNGYYSVGITNPSSKMNRLVDQIKDKSTSTYSQKIDPKTKSVYYRGDQLQKQPVKYSAFTDKATLKAKISTGKVSQFRHDDSGAYQELWGLQSPQAKAYKIKVVRADQFSRISAQTNQLLLVRANNMDAAAPFLTKITDMQAKQYKTKNNQLVGGSFATYQLLKGVFSSLEFMGIFLGIAFLAMLASCLMFKILSGAASDKIRFDMLNKIGTRRSVLKRSIITQILGLFILPGILGIIDVIFGLQMFSRGGLLIGGAYQTFGITTAGFLVLYLIYFAVTVLIYSRIVVPRTKVEK